jgi:glycosyltransferase involved in cell wall biosynthesis
VSLHFLVERANEVIPDFFYRQLSLATPKLGAQLSALWRLPEMKRALDYQELKLINWLQSAWGIVVHSKFAARQVMAHLPYVPIHVIPHFAYRSVPTGVGSSHRQAARIALGLNHEHFVISTVGFVTRNKQYDAILRAISLLPVHQRRRTIYLIGGEVRQHEYDIETQIRERGLEDCVRLTGYLAEARMREVLLASDLVISLRYPTFGESSGAMARALGLGCAIVVTEGGSYSELPEGVCFKAPALEDPSDALANLMIRAFTDTSVLSAVKEKAAAYARDVLDPAMIARRYSDLVRDSRVA